MDDVTQIRVGGQMVGLVGLKAALSEREINDAWQNREGIVPSYKGAPRPQVIEILKRLPRANCRQCGEPTLPAMSRPRILG
jgi:ArsR family metal-binding transcriptional regulator